MILSILTILFALILLIDVIPIFNTWQSRIHIGRWNNRDIWAIKIKAKALSWLNHTPVVPFTDYKRLIFIDILKGNYKKRTIQDWQQAGLLLGLNQAFLKTNDQRIKLHIDKFIKRHIDSSGNWKKTPSNIDTAILAYSLMKVKWIDQKSMQPAYDTIWTLIKEHIGKDGTVQYRKHMSSFRYVDTIGFICPFLITYGVKFSNREAIALGIKQIDTFNQYALLNDTFIPCHTYHSISKTPSGLFGWGRGLGWYAVGLIDAWNALPDKHNKKVILTQNIESFAKMLIKFQNDNGSWNWLITEKKSRADSSATATLAWFLSNATKIDSISSICEQPKDKALTYLMKVTRRNGAIDFSQGDTKGIGVYSQNFDISPFTHGFTLRAIHYS